MSYTLKQAAEATGTSKPTILRAIQKGKVSAAKDDHNEWRIDPAELHRVYPLKSERTDTHNGTDNGTSNDTQHRIETLLQAQIDELKAERERERRQATEQIEDLRRRLDQSEEDRRNTIKLLTHEAAPIEQATPLNAFRSILLRFTGKNREPTTAKP